MRMLFLLIGLTLANTVMAAKSPKRKSSTFVTVWAAEAVAPTSDQDKKALALEHCVEQSQVYVNERLGEGAEYVDYVISRVVMKQQFEAWEKQQADGKYLIGSKIECEFFVKILKAPLK